MIQTLLDLAAPMALAALTAWWVCALIARASRALGMDETTGRQKFHHAPVPRLGGVGIYVALIAALLSFALLKGQHKVSVAFLIVALLPAFAMGLVEDLTRNAGTASRLFAAMLSAALGWWLLKAGLFRVSWDWADALLASSVLAGFIFTICAAAGSAHALNIIDGANGLSGFYVVGAMATLAIIAAQVGNGFVFAVATICAAAVLGFLLLNFPRGRIFLGDAGAYLLGFLIAQLGMILITRHPQVSPWSVMLIMAYPAWEMLFSIYRRARVNVRHVGRPDARHLHQLVYRRILKWAPSKMGREVQAFRSASTTLLLSPLILLCMAPAALFWNQSVLLFWMCWLFAATYTVIYICIARFKVPRFITAVIEGQKRRYENHLRARSAAVQQVQHQRM